MLTPRVTSQKKRPTQSENEGLEKKNPSKWTEEKKNQGSNNYSEKIDFKTKAIKEALKDTS